MYLTDILRRQSVSQIKSSTTSHCILCAARVLLVDRRKENQNAAHFGFSPLTVLGPCANPRGAETRPLFVLYSPYVLKNVFRVAEVKVFIGKGD
jgi:hypothetical protein